MISRHQGPLAVPSGAVLRPGLGIAYHWTGRRSGAASFYGQGRGGSGSVLGARNAIPVGSVSQGLGKFGNCFSFPGVAGSYFQLHQNIDLGTNSNILSNLGNNFTFMVWFRSTPGSGTTQTIYNEGGTGGVRLHFYLSGSVMGCDLNDSATGSNRTSSVSSPAAQRWYQAVFAMGPSGSATPGMNLYLNGEFEANQTAASITTPGGDNAFLGEFSRGAGDNEFPFTGHMDLVTIFDRCLMPSEVSAYYRNPMRLYTNRRVFITPGLPTFSGTVASHESGEASAASGKLTLTGTVASHESGEASAASGKLTLTGTIASASAGEKSAGTETETFSGTVASHSAGEGSAASGSVTVVAAVSQASSGEKSAALGSVSISASLSESSAGEHSAATGSVTISGVVASKSSGEGSSAQGSVGFSGSITQDSAGENSAAISILVGVVTSISSGATESALGAVVPPVIVIRTCGPIAAPGAGSACVIAAPGATSGCVLASPSVGAAYVIPV